jgi:hypothetical protein
MARTAPPGHLWSPELRKVNAVERRPTSSSTGKRTQAGTHPDLVRGHKQLGREQVRFALLLRVAQGGVMVQEQVAQLVRHGKAMPVDAVLPVES